MKPTNNDVNPVDWLERIAFVKVYQLSEISALIAQFDDLISLAESASNSVSFLRLAKENLLEHREEIHNRKLLVSELAGQPEIVQSLATSARGFMECGATILDWLNKAESLEQTELAKIGDEITKIENRCQNSRKAIQQWQRRTIGERQ